MYVYMWHDSFMCVTWLFHALASAFVALASILRVREVAEYPQRSILPLHELSKYSHELFHLQTLSFGAFTNSSVVMCHLTGCARLVWGRSKCCCSVLQCVAVCCSVVWGRSKCSPNFLHSACLVSCLILLSPIMFSRYPPVLFDHQVIKNC